MPDCELLQQCLFFNDKMADMPSTSNMIKLMYCTDQFSGCARYQVRRQLGGGAVPGDLFPNQGERARAIIDGK